MNPNSMTPVDWAKRPVMEKYADFTGRAPRAEYWWYVLAIVIGAIVLSIIESILGLKNMVATYGPLSLLFMLGTLVPSLAVGVRRLHDTNRSGWWILLPIVPYVVAIAMAGPAIMAGGLGAGLGLAMLFMLVGFVCAIALIVFVCIPSTPGDNRYGPNPYGETAATVPAE